MPPYLVGRVLQIERDVYDHVFLSADHTASAEFDQDFSCIHAVIISRLFSMTEEARINTRIAKRQRFSVNTYRTCLLYTSDAADE